MQGKCEAKRLCARDRLEHLLEDFPDMDVRAKRFIKKALDHLREEEEAILNSVEYTLSLFP